MQDTKLLTVLHSNPKWATIKKYLKGEKQDRCMAQKLLDDITEDVLNRVDPVAIDAHMRAVYNATASEYAANESHQEVPYPLLTFMNRPELYSGARILELGAGHLRDARFMAETKDFDRYTHMSKKDESGRLLRDVMQVPKKRFYVTAVDQAEGFFREIEKRNIDMRGIVLRAANFHELDTSLPERNRYNGIWSSAAVFTHTPPAFTYDVLRTLSSNLLKGGVLGLTYTQSNESSHAKLCNEQLRISSVGNVIKYFSQYNPFRLADLAQIQGLRMVEYRLSHFTQDGKIVSPWLFASQIFVKER